MLVSFSEVSFFWLLSFVHFDWKPIWSEKRMHFSLKRMIHVDNLGKKVRHGRWKDCGIAHMEKTHSLLPGRQIVLERNRDINVNVIGLFDPQGMASKCCDIHFWYPWFCLSYQTLRSEFRRKQFETKFLGRAENTAMAVLCTAFG